MKEFSSIHEIVMAAERDNTSLSKIILKNQAALMEASEDELISRMHENLKVMRESITGGMNEQKSASGLTGGQARIFHSFEGRLLSNIAKKAVSYALAISEHNACMGRIVAAPTAGSCGILPAVLIAVGDEYHLSDHELVMGLFNAAGTGMVIAKNASISGAQGGCQAECGSASAMAASALCEIMGGTPHMCAHALAIAFKFVMGLICDPVAGLVEVPCVKRNASGAVNALLAAEMALSGITSAIPADEVIMAVNEVGSLMHYSLKETALGGLSKTPTAKKIQEEIKNKIKGDYL